MQQYGFQHGTVPAWSGCCAICARPAFALDRLEAVDRSRDRTLLALSLRGGHGVMAAPQPELPAEYTEPGEHGRQQQDLNPRGHAVRGGRRC